MTHAQSLNIGDLFAKTWQILKFKFTNLILGIFVIISLIIAVAALGYAVYQSSLSVGFFMKNILAFNIGARIFFYLIYLALGVIAQTILINVFLKDQLLFKENLLSLLNHFWQMLILNIILNLLFLVATAPFSASAIFFIMNNYVLAYASLIAGLALTILVAVLFLFSPFILIDKSLNWLSALKESYNIAKKNIFYIAFDLLVLAFVFLILNFFSILLLNLSLFYIVLGSILSIFLIMFSFSCLFIIYQKYSNN